MCSDINNSNSEKNFNRHNFPALDNILLFVTYDE